MPDEYLIKREEGNRYFVIGAMTLPLARKLLDEGRRVFDRNDAVIDLHRVERVDSTGLAVMLEWMRSAQRHDHKLSFVNIPDNLKSLADVYGVSDLLPAH
ncbi:MAG TPA: STAS domain-containing protein [Burkholderiales bacterium]|nr:STAS domain-containing protein [Burkholderiales bacterium]